jgi:hypothetical protein
MLKWAGMLMYSVFGGGNPLEKMYNSLNGKIIIIKNGLKLLLIEQRLKPGKYFTGSKIQTRILVCQGSGTRTILAISSI